MEQSVLNWIFAGVGAAFGWVLKIIWDAITDLKRDVKDLNTEVHADYVRKDDYRIDIAEIKGMLGRIFDRLDRQADSK
mgnify:CR=1 FL=1